MATENLEWDAAALVAGALGGAAIKTDVRGAPARTHDFEIATAAGKVALEVTSTT
jgi:hypothetical protein